jgi:hypothetical protein
MTRPTLAPFEDAWYQLLAAMPQIQAVVADRLYPQTLDFGGAFPSLTFSLTSKVPTNSQEGFSHFVRDRLTLDLFAREYGEITRGSLLIRQGVTAVRGSVTVEDGSYRIDGILFQNAIDGYHATPKLHHRVLDFLVMHDE